MRRISPRLDHRLLALALLAAACGSFFLPFARITYEDVATVSGVTVVTGVEEPRDPEAGLQEEAARIGGPFATLALAFTLLSAFALVVGARSAAAVLAFVGLASLVVLGLRAFLTLVPAAVDLRPGFWLALTFLGGAAATTAAWGRDAGAYRPAALAALLLAAAGVILFAALLVPAEPEDFRPGDPFARAPFEFLEPEMRGHFWRTLERVTLATAALLAAPALSRGALLAAGAAYALGAAALLRGAGLVAGAARDVNPLGHVPDGPFFLCAAGVLALAAAALAVGDQGALEGARGLSRSARSLAVAGAAVLAAATAIPYDLGGKRDLTRDVALLYGPDVASGFWRAATPIGLAALVAVVAMGRRLPRELATGILLAAGVAAAVFYAAHLTPATDGGRLTSFGPGAVVGIVGAAAVVLAGAISIPRGRAPSVSGPAGV